MLILHLVFTAILLHVTEAVLKQTQPITFKGDNQVIRKLVHSSKGSSHNSKCPVVAVTTSSMQIPLTLAEHFTMYMVNNDFTHDI